MLIMIIIVYLCLTTNQYYYQVSRQRGLPVPGNGLRRRDTCRSYGKPGLVPTGFSEI